MTKKLLQINKKCKYFLSINFKKKIWVLKLAVTLRWFFEHTQHMFWLRKRGENMLLSRDLYQLVEC